MSILSIKLFLDKVCAQRGEDYWRCVPADCCKFLRSDEVDMRNYGMRNVGELLSINWIRGDFMRGMPRNIEVDVYGKNITRRQQSRTDSSGVE